MKDQTIKYKIPDIIDIDKISVILESFSKLTNIVTAILDLDGNILLQTGWREICTCFHRVHSRTAVNCRKSDTILAGKTAEGNKYNVYKCLNGLVDVAVPIIVMGEHLGNLFTGQFLFEQPSEETFRVQALKYNFNEEKYLDALSNVPVIKESEIKDIVNFLLKITEMLAEMGLNSINQIETSKALEESKIFNETLLNTSPDIIYVYDILSKLNVYSNDGITKVLGYSVSEIRLMGDTLIRELMHPDDFQLYLTNIIPKYHHARDDEFIEHEYRMKHKDGKWLWLHSKETIFSRNTNGEPIQIFGIINDITQSRKAEREIIKAKEKAEESDKLKTAFLANMSHEIRTPMNGILGFANLLKNPNLSASQQERYINIIEQSGKRMLNIISDLIDISKIETGQIEIVEEEFKINELLHDLYTFFKPEADKKGLILKYKSGLSMLDSIIQTDKTKLSQVLTNLIGNALKFTKKGNIYFGYSLKDNQLLFYVQDSGIGISYGSMELIFERFRQDNLTPADAVEGSGLGLAISKAYVEKLGGKIWVESEPGFGSTFFFNLPFKRTIGETMPQNTEHSELLDNSNKLVVLIAEDDEISFIYLNEILNMNNVIILHANDGEEAIELCRKHPDINVVLMDIKMPVLNGLEATKRIKQFKPALPIIAQSAYVTSGDKEIARAAGCDDYIEKPVNKEELHFLINKYVKQD